MRIIVIWLHIYKKVYVCTNIGRERERKVWRVFDIFISYFYYMCSTVCVCVCGYVYVTENREKNVNYGQQHNSFLLTPEPQEGIICMCFIYMSILLGTGKYVFDVSHSGNHCHNSWENERTNVIVSCSWCRKNWYYFHKQQQNETTTYRHIYVYM